MEAKRDAVHTSERIVAALRRLWGRKESPSLDEVASEANIGIATLYRHFPNRIALEKAALSAALHDDLESILTPLDESDSDNPLIVQTAVLLVDAIHRHIQSLTAAGMVEALDDILLECSQRLAPALRYGQECGIIRSDLDATDLFWLLRMLILGLQSPMSTPEIRSRYVALLAPAMLPPSDDEGTVSQLSH